ncbi:MAG TPA: hypothetical protein VIV12_28390 [Streptosporangiaceae bacterium]
MAVLCRFVDSVSASPSVRLDLNDGTTWRLQEDDTDLTPPSLRRGGATTMLADGGIYPASAYDNRTLRLRFLLSTANADAATAELQKLNRQLNRVAGVGQPDNILIWAPHTSSPVFFRTFRSDFNNVNVVANDTAGGQLLLTVTVLAEPFALGLEQSLGSITVNNDPAAGTNGLYLDVANPLGDVETPLYLRTTSSLAGLTCLLATRRRGDPSAGTYVRQAETLTQGTNTTVQANNASFSGAGSNWSRTAFPDTAWQNRLTGTFPSATASPELRGTYRVFLRGRASATGSTMLVKLRSNPNGTLIDNGEVTVPDSTTLQLIDLGLLQVPFGAGATADGYGTLMGAGGVECAIRARRTAGTASFDYDYVFLAPADTELALVSWPSSPSGPAWVFDGPNDDVYWRGTAGTTHVVASAGASPTYMGGLPKLTPGQASRVFFVLLNGSVSATTQFTASYWPRFLSI